MLPLLSIIIFFILIIIITVEEVISSGLLLWVLLWSFFIDSDSVSYRQQIKERKKSACYVRNHCYQLFSFLVSLPTTLLGFSQKLKQKTIFFAFHMPSARTAPLLEHHHVELSKHLWHQEENSFVLLKHCKQPRCNDNIPLHLENSFFCFLPWAVIGWISSEGYF